MSLWRASGCLTIALLVGCPAEEPPPLTPPATDDDDDTTEDPPPEPIDLTTPLSADEARAGFLFEEAPADAFVGGPEGESRAGDVLLINDRARFVLQGMREGHNYVRRPGTVIDADVVRPAGGGGRDALNDLATLIGTSRLFAPDTIEVIADGVDGGPAIVRAAGWDAPFTILEGVLESPGFVPSMDLEIVQTYTLEPGSPVLAITTELTNRDDEAHGFDLNDALAYDLGSMDPFVPGVGVGADMPADGGTMLGLLSLRNDLALGLFPDDGLLRDPGAVVSVTEQIGITLARGPALELAPGETVAHTRYLGAAMGLAPLEAARRAIQGLELATVAGALTTDGDDTPIGGARVFLTDADGAPSTVAITDTDGRFALFGDPGEAWVVALGDNTGEQMDLPADLGAYGIHAHPSANADALRAATDPDAAVGVPRADGHGRGDPVAVTLTAGQSEPLDLSLPDAATLRLHVRDGDGEPAPAMVWIRFAEGTSDPRPGDGRLGERRPGGARKIVWVVDGELDVPIVPGSYDLVAHRGLDCEQDAIDGLEVTAGDPVEVTLALGCPVDPDGWASADLHVHATPSPDGKCQMEERVVTAVATGLDVHVATDHDQIADYRPIVAALGVGDRLVSIPGDEVSPVVRGHFNIYPAEPDPTLPNAGAPIWWEMQGTTSELFAAWREVVGDDGFIQINHGRGPGLFDFAGYEPDEGAARDPDFYDETFDAMEILNGGGYSDAEELRADWCSHLDRGLRPIAVGVSDVHGRRPGPGFGRTWVQGGGAPASFDQDDFFEALRAGRAVVSAGPFVELTAWTDDEGPVGLGQTLEGEVISLAARVVAPSWMDVDEVRVYGEGCALLETLPLGELPDGPRDVTVETTVYPPADGYYFVEVVGDGSHGLVWPGAHAYALTNPIFVEIP